MRRRLLSLSIPVKVNLVITMFVLIIIALILDGLPEDIDCLSGVSTYVGGEGLW